MVRVFLTKLLAFLFMGLPYITFKFFQAIFTGWSNVFGTKKRNPPSCLNDPKYGRHQKMTLEKGIDIHYVESGYKNKNVKPLLLFLHGFPDFWFCWRNQLEYFAERYYCVAIDNRGYGDSDKPVGINNYSVINLTDDVRQVIKALGYEKCILVGHDWGGVIGYAFTDYYPEMVSAYISCNMPHPSGFQWALKNSFDQKKKSWYTIFFQCPIIPEIILKSNDFSIFDGILAEGNEKDPEIKEAYKYTFGKNDISGPVNYYRASFQGPKKPLKGIDKVPVLSIYGTEDKYLGLDAFLQSEKYVQDFTFKKLPGISHWVQTEAASQVNSLMEEYLNQRNL